MSNLYKVEFLHASPKDQKTGIVCLLIAENDDQVYEWIKSEPEVSENKLFNCWKDQETDEEEYNIYDDNFNVTGVENFKQRIIRLNGEINDDEYDFSDAYYGITLYGWSLLKENVTTDYSELIELGIVYNAL